MDPTSTGLLVPPASAEPLYLNRELSWLDFNARVLELAQDTALPLLERVRFLAIFASNLDEFFMKRVGALQRQRAGRIPDRTIDGLSVDEQLTAIRARLIPLQEAEISTWLNNLKPALEREGIVILNYDQLADGDRRLVDDVFLRQVFPILTPLAVDPGHPFPFISNLSKSLGVTLERPGRREPVFVRIKMPENLPRYLPLSQRGHFTPLEQVIAGNLPRLFPGMRVAEHQVFRVTRNADIELDERDADDLLELVEMELRKRRMAHVVRLELPEGISDWMKQFIVHGMDVDAGDVYVTRGPIDMDDLMAIANLDLPQHRFRPWMPAVPARLHDEESDIFTVIREGDLLVHHPYEDYGASVERFIAAAVEDPRVLAIKMTVYRTSSDSSFVPLLIRAAEMGKQVAVLVELKARFDEQRNVELAQKLEKSGVHVVYGIIGLKTHAKLIMVVREEADGLRTYCHIGTGNYHPRTAQLYTDLGLFTCDPDLTGDVIEVFHYLTGRSLQREYRRLLVAPVNLRSAILSRIAREAAHAAAGKPARIIAKMNALQDAKIIRALYEASQAGVRIDLLVRGFCCIRPGVPGLSENIRVRSILGRFLEHSRIYHFHNAGDEEFFIGSADWMNRNLDWRVEAVAPVTHAPGRAVLRELLDIMLADRAFAWDLQPDGRWARPAAPDPATATQDLLMERTATRARKVRR